MQLYFNISDDIVTCTNATEITSDTYHKATFSFDNSWSSYGKVAVFSNSATTKCYKVALDSSFSCDVPIAAITYTKKSYLVISVEGLTGGLVRKRTYQPCKLLLRKADNIDKTVSNDVSLVPAGLGEQFAEIANESLSYLNELKSTNFATEEYVEEYVASHGIDGSNTSVNINLTDYAKIDTLSTVAFTGSYEDIQNKPDTLLAGDRITDGVIVDISDSSVGLVTLGSSVVNGVTLDVSNTLLSDTTTTTGKTWSSDKINTELNKIYALIDAMK